MAKEKCELCKEEITYGFMDKPNGTIVKIKENDSNKFVYICSNCQKEHKNKLKEKLL